MGLQVCAVDWVAHMKKAIDGNGADSTSAMWNWLMGHNQIEQCNLYLVGEIGDPNALYLTDYSIPLTWCGMTFAPAAVGILARDIGGGSRVQVQSKIGLDVIQVDVEYSPANVTFANDIIRTSPLQKAALGYYDNWRVRIWRCIMPTAGDATTLGCYELFGGRVGGSEIDQLKIKWSVESWTAVLDQKVPGNLIENTNILASYAGAKPPAGFSTIPRFSVAAGSTASVLLLDCTSTPGHIFSDNALRMGWILFDFPGNSGETLGGVWSIVAENKDYNDGGTHRNQIKLYSPLPWPPTPYAGSPKLGDTCFVSAPFPVDSSEGTRGVDSFVFEYVPAPENAP